MAGGREIKTKIKSVQNTRKVTRALEMVSASKIRKAQDLMKASRPYAKMMRQVIGHIAHATAEYKHPFMVTRETVKRVGYIVVSTDRVGLGPPQSRYQLPVFLNSSMPFLNWASMSLFQSAVSLIFLTRSP